MGQDNKYSDDRLIQDLCREGVDKDAYERLFHRYYPMVLNFVKGLAKSQEHKLFHLSWLFQELHVLTHGFGLAAVLQISL